MPEVDISAQHSKAEKPFFGLNVILEELLEHPLREHVVIARVVRSGLTVNDQRGTSTPRIRPLHIEVISGDAAKKEALALLDDAYRQRTGRREMPPTDLFNGAGDDGDGELEGQTTVGQQLADVGGDPADAGDPAGSKPDPTAGPHFSGGDGLWPGDEGYESPKG